MTLTSTGRRDGAGDPAPASPLSVSVVLATFRRDEPLRRCLLTLVRQQLDRPFDIVVVDDALSPTTPGVIEDARRTIGDRPVSITLLAGRASGPAAARNIGWRAAKGDVIAFTDDDAYPADEGWLARGLAWFENPGVDGVGGAVSVPADEPPTDFQRSVKGLESGRFMTCNAFYRRFALERTGGFDERFELPFREDSDLQFRVEALGGRTVVDRALRVMHPALPGRFGVSLKLQRHSEFNALMYKKHPERYRKELQPSPPLHYYAIVASGGLAVATALLGSRRAPLLLAACWSLLEARFFLRRIRGISHSPKHLLDMAVTSLLIPPLSVYWRLRGAIRFRVLFI